MNKAIILIFLFLAVSLQSRAEDLLQSFNATPQGPSSVAVEWICKAEDNIKEFVVQRSTNKINWSSIKTVKSDGRRNYIEMDHEAYFRDTEEGNNQTQEKTSYFYRLKIILTGGAVEYSGIDEASQTINSIKRTWGMIKEMFK